MGRGGGVAEGRVAHERPYGGEPEVPSPRRVPAIGLEEIEEGKDHGCIEIPECQRRRSASGTLLGEVEQELERIAVTRDGVGTGATLREKASLEEVLQERWKSHLGGLHGLTSCSPRANRSKRWEVMAMSSGTAERYQYVSLGLAWPR